MTRARLYCLSSLGLLAVYGAGLLIAAGPGGFEAMEPFPLGGGGGAGGPLVRTAALALGLSLGWAVPGLSLALLHRPDLEGTALLGRAFGLGAGYLVSTGFVHALRSWRCWPCLRPCSSPADPRAHRDASTPRRSRPDWPWPRSPRPSGRSWSTKA